MANENEKVTMRTPFPAHQISKLPKPTKAQTDAVRANFKAGIRCTICGAWHHPDVIHLDYVGHAALTDRLLTVDPAWNWEPFALDEKGLPALDESGGMWIRLTVLGVTRPGYGDAQGKTGGDAMKERIGDALRNAAMRFGAALDLWHKGDLHLEETTDENAIKGVVHKPTNNPDFKPDEDELKHLQGILDTILGLDKDYEAIKAFMVTQNMDADEKTWVWDKLDSATRSGIKAVK